jgi:cytochrome c biogenesis protein CcmG/thiol:disulfide interchange protein DsbE
MHGGHHVAQKFSTTTCPLSWLSVTVLAVSVDVDDSNYRRFLKDHTVNLLSVRDADQKSNALYGTFKFPETYIIDRNGVMRRKFIGPVDWTEPEVIDFLGKL